MPPLLTRPELENRARRILLTNLRQGVADWNGQEFSFVVPSLTGYPFQWFWDSCFHAIALTHLDPAQAQAELTTLLRAARPDGFIPHIVFWEIDKQPAFLRRNLVAMTSPHYSATIQPPLLAYAVERVYQATGDTAFRDAALPVLTAYYRWLHYHRDPDDDGLIAIIQPEEAGTDCSPKYDAALGLTELSNRGFIAALRQVYDAYAPLRGTTGASWRPMCFTLRMRWSMPFTLSACALWPGCWGTTRRPPSSKRWPLKPGMPCWIRAGMPPPELFLTCRAQRKSRCGW